MREISHCFNKNVLKSLVCMCVKHEVSIYKGGQCYGRTTSYLRIQKQHIVSQPTRVSDLTFEDLIDDVSTDWEGKAMRLQARRWRKLKRQMV